MYINIVKSSSISTSTISKTNVTKTYKVTDIVKKIKFHGCTYLDNKLNLVNIYWTASGFEINFEGTEVNAEFSAKYWGTEAAAYLTVFIDGEKKDRFMLENDIKWYQLAKNLKPGKHNIKVLKNTEAQSNIIFLSSIKITGVLLDVPKSSTRKIEFLGDSITCGWGIIRSEEKDLKYQDGLQTYSAITANNLNADFNVISASGWGIVADSSGNVKNTIPSIYDYICSTYNNKDNQNEKWNFNNFIPDVVVINLGTNDEDPNSGVNATQFKNGVVKFTKNLRQKNPSANIVFVLGMMGNDFGSSLEDTVKQLNTEGDKKVFYFELERKLYDEYLGYGWHPSVKANKEAGDYLTEQIKKITGWK